MSSFENLPAEIHDEIFFHLRERWTPSIFIKVYSPNYHYELNTYDFTRHIFRAHTYFVNHTLWNLRLVSKLLYNSATRALFAHAIVGFHCFNNESWVNGKKIKLQKAIQLVKERVLSPDARLISVIKRAKIEFGDHEGWRAYERFFGYDRSEETVNMFRELIKLLPSTVSKLEKLEYLSVTVPGECTSEYGNDETEGPQLDLEMLAELRSGIASVFKSCSFNCLTDLRITLPCTYDFVVLNRCISDDLVSRIRHLYLGYMDASGQGGSSSYLDWFDEDEDGDDDCRFSNLQEHYPNLDHTSGIFDIVKRCPKLETLGLSGTQRLDLEQLDWRPTTSLQCFYFDRGTVTSANLIRLLSPPADFTGPSPLFSLWLQDIEMTSGTWCEVFNHLLNCPSLSYLNPSDLTYAREGESSIFKVCKYRPSEDSANIWTANGDDEVSMFKLIEKLVEKAGGKEHYPSEQGETMYDPSPRVSRENKRVAASGIFT